MRYSFLFLSFLSFPLPFSSFIFTKVPSSLIINKPFRTISSLKANNKSTHIYKITFNNSNFDDDFQNELNLYEYRLFTLNICIIYICVNYLFNLFK